jgi:hypothetical protein
MLRNLAITAIILTAASLPAQKSAQAIPHTEAETLSDKKIVLPDAFAGHPAILIVGFSRAGGDSCTRWDKELRKELSAVSALRIYSVAELQDAPKMVRGLIRHGMRKNVPNDEQDSFVLLYADEGVWKKLADFSGADDAYILLVDSKNNIQWRTHGKSPDQQALSTLEREAAKLSSVGQ